MIEKIQKINIPQRIWVFIVGTKKPNMATQVSVAVALIIWFYFFSWHLLTFITMSLIGTLDQSAELSMAFNRIGTPYQLLLPGNITTYLWVHALVQLILSGSALTGIILIWRQKKAGFLIYIFSNLALYPITLIILGLNYLTRENSLTDFFLLMAITIYFSAGYFLFYRGK